MIKTIIERVCIAVSYTALVLLIIPEMIGLKVNTYPFLVDVLILVIFVSVWLVGTIIISTGKIHLIPIPDFIYKRSKDD